MKTIKFYPSDRSLIRLDGQMLKGYTINNIPDDYTSWFNYKGLTYITSWQTTKMKETYWFADARWHCYSTGIIRAQESVDKASY